VRRARLTSRPRRLWTLEQDARLVNCDPLEERDCPADARFAPISQAFLGAPLYRAEECVPASSRLRPFPSSGYEIVDHPEVHEFRGTVDYLGHRHPYGR